MTTKQTPLSWGHVIRSLVSIHPYDCYTSSCAREGAACSSCNTHYRKQAIAMWVTIVVMLVLALLFDKLFPMPQYAHPQDLRYHYPYVRESIPSWLCLFLGFSVPLALLSGPSIIAAATAIAPVSKPAAPLIPAPQRPDPAVSPRLRPVVPTLLSSFSALRAVGLRALMGVLSAPLAALGLCTALASSTVLVTVLKTLVGRPRPNAVALSAHKLAKLAASTSVATATAAQEQLQSLEMCVQSGVCGAVDSTAAPSLALNHPANSLSTHLVQEALRSFPSGHSSFAFAGFGFLALVLLSRYRRLRRRTSSWEPKEQLSLQALVQPLFPIPSALPDTFPTCATTDTVSPATNIASSFFPPPTALPVLPAYAALVAYAIIPILSAALIAVSRIIDYWHHADDVLAGSVLGCACAGVAFLVMDNQCDKYK